ncbi:hypothetical protein GCM10027612_87130 [Microbispora bryophytorum subsp. camponoti]
MREDFVLETVYWDAGSARLLPRLMKGRRRGPVFVTHRRPGPGKVVSARRARAWERPRPSGAGASCSRWECYEQM